eukprot:355343-Chlamydomonas_euryale.AAC.2
MRVWGWTTGRIVAQRIVWAAAGVAVWQCSCERQVQSPSAATLPHMTQSGYKRCCGTADAT